MIRERDVRNWNPEIHADPKTFLQQHPMGGAHAIKYRGGFLDVLIEDRRASTTMVVFHSALTDRVRTLPIFSGRGLAEACNVNLVAVSDPSLAMGDVDLAWFLGNRDQGDFRPVLTEIIRHAVAGLAAGRTILFGASGGGYAAVLYASGFPECIAVAANPRLDMGAAPAPAMGAYLNVCHRATSATPMRRIRGEYVVERLADSIATPLNHDLLIIQNQGDHVYWKNQFLPFVAQVDDPRLRVLTPDYARGHKPVPSEMLQSVIETLASDAPAGDAITQAGFHPAARVPV